MSLIEEALRRLQDPLLPTERTAAAPTRPAAPAAPATQVAAPPKPTLIHSWPTATSPAASTSLPAPRTALMIVAAVALLLSLAVVFFTSWLQRREQPAEVNEATVSSGSVESAIPSALSGPMEIAPPAGVARPAGAAHPATATKAPREGRETVGKKHAAPSHNPLILSGVVEGPGEHYALINGAVVAVGEHIEGFTLIEAAQGTARLRRPDGSQMLLHVPQ